MSSGGVATERNMSWRNSKSQGGQQSNRTPSGGNTPRGGRSNTPSLRGAPTANPQSDNTQGRGQGQGQANQRGGRRDVNATANSAKASPTPLQPQPDPELHVPVNEYNANEVKQAMSNSFKQAVAAAGGDEKFLQPKASGTAQPKSAAPWGARPNCMASGQIFMVELARQVKALEEKAQKPKQSNDQARKGK